MLSPEFIAVLTSFVAAKFFSFRKAYTGCGQQYHTISINGAAQRSLKTTIAEVSLGVRAKGKTALEVQKAISESMEKLMAYLKGQNVANLASKGVELFSPPRYSAPDMEPNYCGSNYVSFQVSVDKSGDVLDGSVANGASDILQVEYKAEPELIASAREEVLRDAVANARKEAEIALSAAGKKVGRLLSMSMDDAFVPEKGVMAGQAYSRPPSPYPTELSREQIISATVEVEYSIA